jgi:hypothetical protein
LPKNIGGQIPLPATKTYVINNIRLLPNGAMIRGILDSQCS